MYCLLIPNVNRGAFSSLITTVRNSPTEYGNLRIIEDVSAIPTAQNWLDWNIEPSSVTIILGLSATETLLMGYTDASYSKLLDDARRLVDNRVYALVYDSNQERATQRVEELYSQTNLSPQFQWLINNTRLLVRQSTALSQNPSLATMFTVIANRQKQMSIDARLPRITILAMTILIVFLLLCMGYNWASPRIHATNVRASIELRALLTHNKIGGH